MMTKNERGINMEAWLTKQQAAQAFQVSDQTIDNWRLKGKLIGRRIGTRWHFDKAQVYRILAEAEELRQVPIDWATVNVVKVKEGIE
jgi:predicted site-specific integrase-resolvase